MYSTIASIGVGEVTGHNSAQRGDGKAGEVASPWDTQTDRIQRTWCDPGYGSSPWWEESCVAATGKMGEGRDSSVVQASGKS